MQSFLRKQAHGFTIVELLIAIVIVAILATIGIVSYNGAVERSKVAQAYAQLDTLRNAIVLAQTQSGKSLKRLGQDNPSQPQLGAWEGTIHAISGDPSEGIDHPCPIDMKGVYMTDPSNGCVKAYLAMLTRLEAASGADLSDLRKGDPWGRPYVIDDEEYGSAYELCNSTDRVFSAGPTGMRADYDQSTGTIYKFKTPPDGFEGILITIPPAQLPHNVNCDDLETQYPGEKKYKPLQTEDPNSY